MVLLSQGLVLRRAFFELFPGQAKLSNHVGHRGLSWLLLRLDRLRGLRLRSGLGARLR